MEMQKKRRIVIPTEEQIIQNLQAKAERDDTRKLSISGIMGDSRCFTPTQICAVFADIYAAVRAAGLYPAHPNEADLIRSLHEFYAEYGRVPVRADAEGILIYSVTAYMNAFKTWNRALEAAGFKARRWNRYFTEDICREIADEILVTTREMFRENGILPPQEELARQTGFTTWYVKHYIGSYEKLAELTKLELHPRTCRGIKSQRTQRAKYERSVI